MTNPLSAEHTLHPDLLARQVAGEILTHLFKEYTPLDVCITRSTSYQALNPQDRAFCLRLMQSYLRHKGQINHQLKTLLQKPLPSDYDNIGHHIGLAMVEIAVMDIPPYAAVNSAVELVKTISAGYTGLANAVLNTWVKSGAPLNAPLIDNIPQWLANRWLKHYRLADIQNIAEILVQEPALDISFKHAEGIGAVRTSFADDMTEVHGNTLRITYPGRVSDIAGFTEGHWWVQDLAASIPVMLMGDVAGKNILDMCAAPGGKTMQLAAKGANVTAVDSSKKRLQIVAENLARTKLHATLVEKDVLKYQSEQPFDAILLDAPCSATGTFRRNPDVLWVRHQNNLLEITLKQQKMLEKAVSMLAVGGILLYAVCSMEPEEGEMQIERLLKSHADIIVDSDLPALPITMRPCNGLGFRTLCGDYKNIGGVDGFFMTKLRKV